MRLDHLIAIADALNRATVRYLVVGGVAVNAHGYLRYTHDLDLVLKLEPANVVAALEALGKIGYRPKIPVAAAQFADATLREQWRREKGMLVFPLWCDARRETPVDIFVYEPFDFDHEYASAEWFKVAEDTALPIVPFAALVELKRAAARPQDLADIDRLEKARRA